MSHSAELAGAERSLAALVARASQRGHQVVVWLPGPGPLASELRDVGVTDLRVCANHWWMSRRGCGPLGAVRTARIVVDAAAFARDFRRVRPDAVVVNSSVAPAALLAARLTRLPVLTVVRESLHTNPTLRSVLPKRAITRIIDACSSAVVCVSRYVATQYGYAATVVPPPVAAPRTSAIDAVGAPPPLRAVILGTLGGDKGQEDAVLAVAECRRRGVEVELAMHGAGSGSLRDALRRLAVAKGVEDLVTVTGAVPDVAGALGRAHVSLVLSRNEAYGRVTVESLLCGVPVVGYAAGGTSELLEAGGGLLTRPSASAVADALVRLTCDPAELGRLRSAARGRAAVLAARSSADELLEIVERLVTVPRTWSVS